MKKTPLPKLLCALAGVSAFAMAANVQAATILNFTDFVTGESTSDGNIVPPASPSFSNPGGTTFDTVNGWTWGTINALSGGPAAAGVFSGLGLGTIRDQGIRAGSGLELVTGSGGSFNFGWGGNNTQTALAQGFTVNVGDAITLTYDMTGSQGGMYFYIDNGSGSYVRDNTVLSNGTGITRSFVATGTNIRIAVLGNDGADSNASLGSIKVESVPEPSVFGLIGLGGLAILRRRRP